jgi:hypothetical protein
MFATDATMNVLLTRRCPRPAAEAAARTASSAPFTVTLIEIGRGSADEYTMLAPVRKLIDRRTSATSVSEKISLNVWENPAEANVRTSPTTSQFLALI